MGKKWCHIFIEEAQCRSVEKVDSEQLALNILGIFQPFHIIEIKKSIAGIGGGKVVTKAREPTDHRHVSQASENEPELHVVSFFLIKKIGVKIGSGEDGGHGEQCLGVGGVCC